MNLCINILLLDFWMWPVNVMSFQSMLHVLHGNKFIFIVIAIVIVI